MFESSIDNSHQEEIHSEFPMVVFLRGDEKHFSDFCMGADEVMERLGIRRSRLNQISGRELRVGRARINSYVRPVYRKVDVEEYLKWIRPTATHKKSSEMLNEARYKLEEQSDKLAQQLSSRFESLAETITGHVQTHLVDQRKHTFNLVTAMKKTLTKNVRTLLQRSAFVQAQSVTRWEQTLQRFEDIQKIKKDLEEIKTAAIHVSDIGRYSERMLLDLQKNQKELKEKMHGLHTDLEALKSSLPQPIPASSPMRQRRGEGIYSRSRKLAYEEPIREEPKEELKEDTMEKIQNLVPHWRRRKLSKNF